MIPIYLFCTTGSFSPSYSEAAKVGSDFLSLSYEKKAILNVALTRAIIYNEIRVKIFDGNVKQRK